MFRDTIFTLEKDLQKTFLGSEDNAEFTYVEAASRVEYLQSAKVDVILANFTVTDDRAEKVDFALPYMKVALGVVSPDDALIKDVKDLEGKKLIVVKGTTAETYFTDNYPDIELVNLMIQEAYDALLDGRGDAFSTDNTEVLAWAQQNEGFSVGSNLLVILIRLHQQYRRVTQTFCTQSTMRLNLWQMNSSSIKISKKL